MAYNPINTDAPAVAAETIERVNSLFAAMQPPLPGIAAPDDAMTAFADALLCAMGHQAQDVQASYGLLSTTSTSFVNAYDPAGPKGYAPWTWVCPITKTYEVEVALTFVTNGSAFVTFQLTVDGVGYNSPEAGFVALAGANSYRFTLAIPFTAGVHTLLLQWKTGNGAVTLSTVVTNFRTFRVRG